MRVYDLLRKNQAFASATVLNDELPELCVPGVQPSCKVKETIGGAATAPTGERVDLLELLPEWRRAEAQEIIDCTPAMIDVLRRCNRYEIDCWTAMELMGIDPWAE